MPILDSKNQQELFRHFLECQGLLKEVDFTTDGLIANFKYYENKDQTKVLSAGGPDWNSVGPTVSGYEVSINKIPNSSDWTAQIQDEELFTEDFVFTAIMKSVINHHMKLTEVKN